MKYTFLSKDFIQITTFSKYNKVLNYQSETIISWIKILDPTLLKPYLFKTKFCFIWRMLINT